MGGSSSSEERDESKVIDTNGNVNNNVIIKQEAHDIHDQLLTNQKLLTATYLLIALELLKFFIYLYVNFKKNLKKKYMSEKGIANNP